MGAADHSEAGEGHADAVTWTGEERGVDRSHNRDTLSSEAMTEMLRDIQDAMLAVDERLVALESSGDGAMKDTRKLAQGVADLGDALARRVRALEHGRAETSHILARPLLKPARQPPQNRVAWSVGLLFVLAVVLAAFWLLGEESLDHAVTIPPHRPAAAPPPPAAPPVADVTPVTPPAAPKTASHTVMAPHRPTPRRVSSADTARATNSTTAATGFDHYGPSPSVVTPPPSRPPS